MYGICLWSLERTLHCWILFLVMWRKPYRICWQIKVSLCYFITVLHLIWLSFTNFSDRLLSLFFHSLHPSFPLYPTLSFLFHVTSLSLSLSRIPFSLTPYPCHLCFLISLYNFPLFCVCLSFTFVYQFFLIWLFITSLFVQVNTRALRMITAWHCYLRVCVSVTKDSTCRQSNASQTLSISQYFVLLFSQ